jgi:hypothetical protein
MDKLKVWLQAIPSEDCVRAGAGAYADALLPSTPEPPQHTHTHTNRHKRTQTYAQTHMPVDACRAGGVTDTVRCTCRLRDQHGGGGAFPHVPHGHPDAATIH